MDNNNEDSVKGILKGGGKQEINPSLKSAKFDELNILETFHPIGKDYGHMIIDEPKTPFVFDDDIPKELDTNALIEKLRLTSKSEMPDFGIEGDSDDSSADEDFPESVEESVRRKEFERRRKLHYKEFLSVPLARRLIAEEFSEWTSEPSYLNQDVEDCPDGCSDMLPIPEEGQTRSISSTNVESPTETLSSPEKSSAEQEPEPGFDPRHPCYQKLNADISGTKTSSFASLTHLRSIPSIRSSDRIENLQVPDPSARPTDISGRSDSVQKIAPRVFQTTFKDMPTTSNKK
ncbi:hypothetical protein KR009_001814 [Drosophila setifemur]|nr:hypothetical protein KR009_001814 [Drosophila setifemur]